MKITGFYDNKEGHGKGFLVWPDSVWLRNGKPMFLPSEDEIFKIILAPCIKIDRVGKSVTERFAGRYYSQAAYTAVMLNERAYNALRDGKDPYATDICNDCCILTGNFLDKTVWEKIKNINITFFPLLFKEGSEKQAYSLSFDPEDFFRLADMAVAMASRRNTLKTGDFIIPMLEGFMSDAILDTKFEVGAEGVDLLAFKVK